MFKMSDADASNELSFPLPIYQLHRIGSITAKDGSVFSLVAGLDQDLVDELKKRSLDQNDTDLQQNTSDRLRFGEGSYEEWYAKGRVPFGLLDSEGHLAALAWFGPKTVGRKSLRYLTDAERAAETKEYFTDWHTIVYRSYAPYRGAGLMTAFLEQCIGVYKAHFPHAKLWAGISTENPASIALARKLGFEVSEEYSDPEAKWCAMIEK